MKYTHNVSKDIKKAPYDIKVSVLVPCCNVEKYIRQCMDSIIAQTLDAMEIICINDGSKDGTLDILKEYAVKDKRIKIIDKQNSGYGDSMDKGLEMAVGKYIGIVESDDFIESEMFEKLYETAEKYDAEIVKSNFWLYWSSPERNELHEFIKKEECNVVLDPSTYNNASLFGRKPSIWSAIYNRQFLADNNIRFLKTPGASFQDTSFTFKAYAACKRMVCVYDAFLHYRQDNEASSVNNADKKMDFICAEYDEIKKYISQRDDKKYLYPVYGAMFYDACIWMYERLSVLKRYEFLKKISPIFKSIIDTVGVNQLNFGDSWWKRRDIVRIANDPYEYHMWRNVERYEQIGSSFVYKPTSTPIGNAKEFFNKVTRENDIEQPFFSIIIPVYNNEKYLRSCLDSLILQTDNDFEAICINDGSKDHSLSLLEEYATYSKQITVINQNNAGPSETRNVGLKIARGKYILFLDSDDYIAENTCEVLKQRILGEKRPLDAVLFGTRLFPEVPRASDWHYSVLTTPDEYYDHVSQKVFLTVPYFSVYSWRYCFKLTFLEQNRLHFEELYKYGEDAIFVMSAVTRMKGILVISDKLYNYRHYREDSLMNTIVKDNAEYAKIQLSILKRLLDVAKDNGYLPCVELLEYSCNFIYGSISGCPEPQRTLCIREFVSLIKKNGFDVYSDFASENCRGFWEYCVKVCRDYKEMHTVIKAFRHLVAKVIPPSRKVFYDNIKLLNDNLQRQQYTLNYMQQQLNELQQHFSKQEELIAELKNKLDK